jgi:hypothetical protein
MRGEANEHCRHSIRANRFGHIVLKASGWIGGIEYLLERHGLIADAAQCST